MVRVDLPIVNVAFHHLIGVDTGSKADLGRLKRFKISAEDRIRMFIALLRVRALTSSSLNSR